MELVLIGVAARPDTLLRFRPWDGSGAGVRAVLPGAACNRSHGSGAFRQQHFQVRLDGQAGRLAGRGALQRDRRHRRNGWGKSPQSVRQDAGRGELHPWRISAVMNTGCRRISNSGRAGPCASATTKGGMAIRVTTRKASTLKADKAKYDAMKGKGPIPCVTRAMCTTAGATESNQPDRGSVTTPRR